MDIAENVCKSRKEFCDSCNSHFMEVRPLIKEVIISKHFKRDLKDEEEMNSIIKNVLECSHTEFHELHKFEENIDDNLIFRAKKDKMHILYCVTKNRRMIFLRAIRNYDEYKKLLDDKKELKKMIEV
jgi:mRNA-degrading endonuclease RelE of RelBE toxin-antitoxin system